MKDNKKIWQEIEKIIEEEDGIDFTGIMNGEYSINDIKDMFLRALKKSCMPEKAEKDNKEIERKSEEILRVIKNVDYWGAENILEKVKDRIEEMNWKGVVKGRVDRKVEEIGEVKNILEILKDTPYWDSSFILRKVKNKKSVLKTI